jgi:hypothetical protein
MTTILMEKELSSVEEPPSDQGVLFDPEPYDAALPRSPDADGGASETNDGRRPR